MAWAETNPKDHPVPSPLPWQGCHPLDQVVQGSTSLAKSWVEALFCSSAQKCSVSPESSTKTKQLPELGRSLLLLRAQSRGTSQTQDPMMTCRCVSQAKSWFCCLSTAKKAGIALWVCTQTQGHDTYSAQGCYQLCVIWMDSPLETLNAEMLHRQRRWLKIFAWTPLNCPRTCSRHFFCGKNTDCIQRNLLQLHHLPSWCRTHPFNLSQLHGEQLSASPTDEGIELSQPALSTLIKLLLSNYFISTA